MSFEHLRAFLAVAEQGSFLSASVTLGVSRTTLRRQVDVLEAETGTPLLQRGQKGVVLTDAGRHLLGKGREMEQEFNALLRAARESGRRPEGEVRMLLQLGLPPQGLVAFYLLLRNTWPEVRFRAHFAEAPVSADLTDVDLAAWFGEAEAPATWVTYTVLVARQRLFASSTYLRQHGEPQSLNALLEHDLHAWVPTRHAAPMLVTTDGRSVPIQPTGSTTNVQLIHEFVDRGLGIGWAPDAGLPHAVGGEPFVGVLSEQFGRDVPLRLAVPRLLLDVPKVRVFIEGIQAMREAFVDAKLVR